MKYKADWASLKDYRVPDWYRDAKFGVFIHWGIYSVPAFDNEWYPRNMYLKGQPAYEHHVKTYGPQKEFGYKDFIPNFTAERWDPDEWASTFEEAGARYVVLVAEHHDGFSLWDSEMNRWNAAKMGPKRDVVKELSEAVRRRGLKFGVSYHRAEHWWYFEGGRQMESDVSDPAYQDLYGPAMPSNTQPNHQFLEEWLKRAEELVSRYRPSLFYFDWWIENSAFERYLRDFAAFYYNEAESWGEEVVINYKHNAFPEGTAVLDVERGKLGQIRELPWQTDTSICYDTWGYTTACKLRSSCSIITDLADITSKNGNLLLNVAPRPDGTIPQEQRRVLSEVGGWLKRNGEAIYSTRPWTRCCEGPTRPEVGEFREKEQRYTERDFRFTSGDESVYVIGLSAPKSRAVVRSLGSNLTDEVKSVSLLGRGELKFEQNDEGLFVDIPPESADGPYSLKVKMGR
ncbi:alpha-L-fucosidase [Tardisphaera miroshnichenkoae]